LVKLEYLKPQIASEGEGERVGGGKRPLSGVPGPGKMQ